MTTQASCRASELNRNYVRKRLSDQIGCEPDEITIEAMDVDVRTLDSFGLNPLAIKLDVEGFEGSGADWLEQYKQYIYQSM